MREPGLDNRHRDKKSVKSPEIRQKQGDILSKNHEGSIRAFKGDVKLSTVRTETGSIRVDTVRAATGKTRVATINHTPIRTAKNMYTLQHEREEDGRWLAEVPELPGVLAYGITEQEAMRKAEALAFRVIADRLENNEIGPQAIQFALNVA